MLGCGFRRSESVAVHFKDLDPAAGAIRILGKCNRERTIYAPRGAQAAIDGWLDIRGQDEGPLLTRDLQTGVVTLLPMTAQSFWRDSGNTAGKRGPGTVHRTFFGDLSYPPPSRPVPISQLSGPSPDTPARRPRHAMIGGRKPRRPSLRNSCTFLSAESLGKPDRTVIRGARFVAHGQFCSGNQPRTQSENQFWAGNSSKWVADPMAVWQIGRTGKQAGERRST